MRSLTALCASRARVICSADFDFGFRIPDSGWFVRRELNIQKQASRFRSTPIHNPKSKIRNRLAATLVSSVALSLLLFAAAAHAQDLDDVSVSGSVIDQHGAAVEGARVTATHAATK